LLKRILSVKRSEVTQARRAKSLQLMKEELAKAPPTRNFTEAVRRKRPFEINLIGEMKRASPSKGMIRARLDPAAMAREFEKGGAKAISVLTEARYFKGSLTDLKDARAACGLPVLRKDFIVDEYQIYESRLAGADAILLITGLLPQKKLVSFMALARNLSLAALVEVHTLSELKRVLATDAPIIGINTRNLTNLKVDASVAVELRPQVPPERIVIYESGIEGVKQMDELREMKFDSALVGDALMRARSPVALIHELLYP